MSSPRLPSNPDSAPLRRFRDRGRRAEWLIVGAAIVAVTAAIVVAMPNAPEQMYVSAGSTTARHDSLDAQSLAVPEAVKRADIERDAYSATYGFASLAESGTNYDWAKMVLLAGGWPRSDANVTVIVRWMRQENYIDSWWNRNNPLNNGWGSGGGGGLGSYPSLTVAAKMAADALTSFDGYHEIRAALASSAPTAVTEAAIWASPWASGHYANGSHWHYTPVPVVKAPASAW